MGQQRPDRPGNGIARFILPTADCQLHIGTNLFMRRTRPRQNSDHRTASQRIHICWRGFKIGNAGIDRRIQCRHRRQAARLGIRIATIIGYAVNHRL